jgi:thioredoxin
MLRNIATLIVLATFSLASCNSKGETTTKVNEPETATAKSEENKDEKGAIHLTKQDFLAKVMDYESNPQEWVYKGDKPALIDFYASWCGPCKIAGPILEELAVEYKDEIYIYKINTEVERELAAVFGIQGIPAFLYVPQDGRPTMTSGIGRTPEQTKEMFRNMIDELLLNKKVSASL